MVAMAAKVRIATTYPYIVAWILLVAFLYHRNLYDAIYAVSPNEFRPFPSIISASGANRAIHENVTVVAVPPPAIPNTAVLFPGWEVLVIVPTRPAPSKTEFHFCLFETGEFSPARFAGVLRFPDRDTFNCILPPRARRMRPYKQPTMVTSRESGVRWTESPQMLRSTYLAYDSLTTEDDVVLFVKGVNTRQGVHRSPDEFLCVFGDDVANGVRTPVTSSKQEVFRCRRPHPMSVCPAGAESAPVKISLEIVAENKVVPSVTHYTPPRRLESDSPRSLLCATTMVYNVNKFLREWIIFHSRIGVEKFLLYDNGSEDGLETSVLRLVEEGYDVNTYSWPWPKTQEAGFSHSVLYANGACKWMMYLDVDEFLYSPSWQNFSKPSTTLLRQLIPTNSSSESGQITIGCHEFGPSGHETHPARGVTQGYNCRRKLENRHKSLVLLDAVDNSLLNVVHHFDIRPNYATRKVSARRMVINHYKYQAWPEFKAKFRRRVSAYVSDWTTKVNAMSKDRAPGLGFMPVEPKGWPEKFCEVYDNDMKDLTDRWFRLKSSSEIQMIWQ